MDGNFNNLMADRHDEMITNELKSSKVAKSKYENASYKMMVIKVVMKVV